MSGFTNAMLRLREEIHNRLTVVRGLPTSLHLESEACRGKAGIKAETSQLGICYQGTGRVPSPWQFLPREPSSCCTIYNGDEGLGMAGG